uniref:inhibin beta C chain-like n=1 Tax=Pristiophorus japonicus TaxID=55135 RepID=UPI00398EE2BE
MLSLPISLAIFVSLAPFRMSHFLPASDSLVGPTHNSSAVSAVNRSNERAVQEIKIILLRALNLQHIPRIHRETVDQLRQIWRASLQASSHSLRDSATDQQLAAGEIRSQGGVLLTGANESTPTSPKNCCQTAAQISLTDLGWEHWILYPEQITYVACASCRHPRAVMSLRCHRDGPLSRSQAHRRSCCKAVKTVWIPIVYVDEDMSLVTTNIPLTEECGW